LSLNLNCETQSYDLAFNGQWIRKDIPFAEKVETIERLVFRTGQYRGEVSPGMVNGAPKTTGMDLEDLAGADQKVPQSVYLIDDVKTNP
jgi:sialidase-like protein